MYQLQKSKCGASWFRKGSKAPHCREHSLALGLSPTLDSQTVASPAHPAQPPGLCKCCSLCLGCPPLVCLPSKGFCVLCHLKDCLPCEVSTGSPRQTQAPLSLSFIHIYPAFIISLQVSLPTGLWALRPVVWGDTGLPPRVTDLGVLLHCTPNHPGLSEAGAKFSVLAHLIKHGVRLAPTSLGH